MSFSWHCKIERTRKTNCVFGLFNLMALTLIQYEATSANKWMMLRLPSDQQKEGDWRSVKHFKQYHNHQFPCFNANEHDTLCHRRMIFHCEIELQQISETSVNIKCRVMSCLHSAHHLSHHEIQFNIFHLNTWHDVLPFGNSFMVQIGQK